ncbi:hypothetical protein GCM10009123_16550 [Kangiella japonica]|uniref:HNH endonuclease n=1 Tax=Kangiella japonica TaxID=647384 RepID=A0ABN0T1W3_9GAMM
MTDILCWICGETAPLSKEHLIKHSDLKTTLGLISQQAPKYFHTLNEEEGKKISSFKRSELLRSEAPMCNKCNNDRTQKYDRSWQRLHSYLLIHQAKTPKVIDLNEVFSEEPLLHMDRVQLYFAKIFGCRLVSNSIHFPIHELAEALLHDKAHPNIYLSIGYSQIDLVGISPLINYTMPNNNESFVWMYSIGHIQVQIGYSKFHIPNTKEASYDPSKKVFQISIQQFP